MPDSPLDLDASLSYDGTGQHCTSCGRALSLVEEPAVLYDASTGARGTDRYWQCPRFARSWRNLWMGGLHDSLSVDGITGRRWM